MPLRIETIKKEDIKRILLDNPNISTYQLAKIFGCGHTTIVRRLKEYGLTTQYSVTGKHSQETKHAMSIAQSGKKKPTMSERQRGENNPIHKVKYLYEDPEYVAKITRGIREHVKNKKGKTYEEVYGKEKAEEYKEKLRKASPARLAKFKRKETKPEKIVRELLEHANIRHIPQAPLGYYTVDFLIQDRKVVIQTDGDYWHANPKEYGSGKGLKPLSKRQKTQQRLDASCNSYLRNQGYTVIRLWEYDLYNSLQECNDTIHSICGGLHERKS